MEHLNVGSPNPNTNGCGSDACIIPITGETDKDETWLARKMSCTRTSMKPQIPKVPQVQRDIEDHKKCFDPVVLSIGPYHHGKAEFEMVQNLKIACAQQFVSGRDPNIFCSMVEKVATTARDYYDWSMIEPRPNDKEFAWMMFVDGCFILHFIDWCINEDIPSELDKHKNIRPHVRRDLFLLENQLPYVVLKEFMSFKYTEAKWQKTVDIFVDVMVSPLDISSSEDGAESYDQRQPLHLLDLLWNKLVVSRVNAQTSSEDGGDEQQQQLLQHHRSIGDGEDDHRQPLLLQSTGDGGNDQQQPLHLLALLWTKLVGSRDHAQTSGDLEIFKWRSCPTINELIAVGINIKRSNTSCLNDIHFRPTMFGGELLLPQMVFDDYTREKFLNLVAYERSIDTDDFPVSSYLYFMDTLIDDADDVKKLRSKRILYNCLGTNQEVADHFNKLGVGLVMNPDGYLEVIKGIDKYYESNIRVSIGEFVYSHFRSTWSYIATIAAGITILLTSLSTIFSLLSYFKVM